MVLLHGTTRRRRNRSCMQAPMRSIESPAAKRGAMDSQCVSQPARSSLEHPTRMPAARQRSSQTRAVRLFWRWMSRKMSLRVR